MLPPEGIPFLEANDMSIELFVPFLKTSDVDALNIQPVHGEGKRAGVGCTEVCTVIPSDVLLAPPMLVWEHETETLP